MLLGKDGAMLLPAVPLWKVECQVPLLWQDFQLGAMLGDTLAEGWLQTSLPSPPQEAQALEAVAEEGDTFLCREQKLSLWIAALPIPKAKGTEPLPLIVLKSSDLPLDNFLGVYSLDSSAFMNIPLKTLEDMQVLHGLWVRAGQSTGKQLEAKDKSPGSEGGEETPGISVEMPC